MTKTKRIVLRVPVTVSYESEKGLREAMAEVKSDLYIRISGVGPYGCYDAETGRPMEIKTAAKEDRPNGN